MKKLFSMIFDKTFLRFLLVGVVNTLVGTGIMFGLYNVFGCPYWISIAANYFFGGIVSYILNKRFTFRSTDSGVIEVVGFAVNVAVCCVIGYGVAKPIVVALFAGADTRLRDNLAMLVGMGLYVVLNYFGQRLVVFGTGDKRAHTAFVAALEGIFLFILSLNMLTPYVADDFVYRLSFYGEKLPITHFTDLFPSLYQHSLSMNGRVVSHFFEQFFMLFPKVVFNLCNSLIFVALVYLLYRIINQGSRRQGRSLLLIGVFAALWQYLPVFGQVALWQVGSVNYLWGLFGATVFLTPYFCYYADRPALTRGWQRVLFCLAAVPFGMYIEVASFIGVLLAVLLLLCGRAVRGTSLRTWLWVPAGCAAVGYVLLMLMPAQVAAKQSVLTLAVLMDHFATATAMLRTYALPLLVLWAVFAVLAYYARLPRERLVLSAVLVFGALAANYMLVVAKYYPDRCAAMTVVLLILAVGLLIAPLTDTAYAPIAVCYGGLLAVLCAFSMLTGVHDIWVCHVAVNAREQTVAECLERGERDLELKLLYPKTAYSAFYGVVDLNTETTETWPNRQMAEYYGVDTILGVE